MSLVVPVLVEGWQHACCGDALTVGTKVSWRLLLRPGAWWEPVALPVVLAPLDPGAGQEWESTGNRLGPSPAVARHGALVVFLPDAGEAGGGVLRGGLQEDRHVDVPGGVPPTDGIVRRIRLVMQTFRRAHRGELVPMPGRPELQDLDEAPRMLPEVAAATDPLLVREATGLLVDLDVDPGRTSRV